LAVAVGVHGFDTAWGDISLRRNTLAATGCAAVLVLGLSACNSKSSSSSAASNQDASITAIESSTLAQASQAAAAASTAASSIEASDSVPAESSPADSAPADSSEASDSAAPSDSSAADGASSGAAPAGFNACSLLSVSKAESITGNKFDKSAADHIDRNDYTCTFNGADNGSDLLMDVAVPSDETTWDVASQSAAEGGTSVPGVGKRALAGGIGFVFDTGKYYISFQFADESGDKNAIALAKYILTEPGAA
jgi:hypothetical protein